MKVPFDKSFAPGPKNFDFDINQISITPDRKKAVDMSDGYYTVNQAVVALNGTKAAQAKTIADLQALKLGAQVGTTSLTYVKDVVKPTQDPYVFNSTNDAKSALNNKQIDAIVVDLPTAYFITAVEIEQLRRSWASSRPTPPVASSSAWCSPRAARSRSASTRPSATWRRPETWPRSRTSG